MCRFIAIVLASILTIYSTFAAFFGVFSLTWWTGTRDVGIASNCNSGSSVTVNGLDVAYCTDFSLDALANDTERAMAGLLMVAIILGILALIVMVFNIIFACCCINLAGPVTAGVIVLQGLCILATCITMGFYYSWEYPVGTDSLGAAYILNIVAVVASLSAASLTGVHHYRTRSYHDDMKLKNSKHIDKRAGTSTPLVPHSMKDFDGQYR
eukprot:CFRG7148T1